MFEQNPAMQQEPAYLEPPLATENSIIKSTDPAIEAKKLKMRLKGYIWNEEKKKWAKAPGKKPLMNDAGVEDFMNDIEPFVSDTSRFSSLDTEEAEKITIQIADTVTFKIAEKADKWELDESNFNTVYNLCIPIFLTLKRAVMGREKKWIGGMYDERVYGRRDPAMDPYGGMSYGPQQSQKKEGLFGGLLNPFKKR